MQRIRENEVFLGYARFAAIGAKNAKIITREVQSLVRFELVVCPKRSP